jgi:hypothetical protein
MAFDLRANIRGWRESDAICLGSWWEPSFGWAAPPMENWNNRDRCDRPDAAPTLECSRRRSVVNSHDLAAAALQV